MADLFREVDEAMRQERMMKFWEENKLFIIGVVLGTILLTGALSAYRSWNNAVKEEQTAAVLAMQEDINYPQNVLETEDLDVRGGLRGIALLQAAGMFQNQDKPDEALTLYQRISADKAIPDELHHLGVLMSVRMQMDKDNTDADELLNELSPVLKTKSSPWVNHARIEAALIHAHKKGDYDSAISLLQKVEAQKDIPASLTSRAKALIHIFTTRQQSPAAQKDEQTG